MFFFFQAEDGIRDFHVTGVQTCALPIYVPALTPVFESVVTEIWPVREPAGTVAVRAVTETYVVGAATPPNLTWLVDVKPSPFTVTRAPNPPEAGENPVTPTQEGILKCPIRVFQSSSVVGAE